MPTVHPRRAAMLTIWSVVWTAFGRRIFGIASMSSTRANSFMPITVVFSRNRLLRSVTREARSIVSGVCCCMGSSPPGAPAPWRLLSRVLVLVLVLGRARKQLAGPARETIRDEADPFPDREIGAEQIVRRQRVEGEEAADP